MPFNVISRYEGDLCPDWHPKWQTANNICSKVSEPKPPGHWSDTELDELCRFADLSERLMRDCCSRVRSHQTSEAEVQTHLSMPLSIRVFSLTSWLNTTLSSLLTPRRVWTGGRCFCLRQWSSSASTGRSSVWRGVRRRRTETSTPASTLLAGAF